jgi:hypothetical protein
MNRIVEPELLDELPTTDPRAIRSRRDLRRINGLMGNARIVHRFIENALDGPNLTIAEIGCGDGNISMQVARRLSGSGHLILIDQQALPPIEMPNGWSHEMIQADVFEWFKGAPQVNIIIANLFLHHFDNSCLRDLLTQAASACRCFVACEPRRNSFAHWFARRLNLIGCNEVTCNDAAISVRAGFCDAELSAIWPSGSTWRLTERRAGLFSHLFAAVRA